MASDTATIVYLRQMTWLISSEKEWIKLSLRASNRANRQSTHLFQHLSVSIDSKSLLVDFGH